MTLTDRQIAWITIACVYAAFIVFAFCVLGFKGVKRRPEHDDPTLVCDPATFAAAPVSWRPVNNRYAIRAEVLDQSASLEPSIPTGVRAVGDLSIRQRIPDALGIEVVTTEVAEMKAAIVRYRVALQRIRATTDDPYTKNFCDGALNTP